MMLGRKENEIEAGTELIGTNDLPFFRGGKSGIPSKSGGEGSLRKNLEGGLSGEDFLFLLGLGLFILFLVLAHPLTPGLAHQSLILWASITMLFLSMAPDYVNRETAKKWMETYKDSRVGGFFERIYGVAQDSDRYFGHEKFFVAGILMTLVAVIALFYTGRIQEVPFGISYGILMRAILG